MTFNYKKLLGEQSSAISNKINKFTNNLGVGDPNFRIPKKEVNNLIKKINNKDISYTNPSGLYSLKKKICFAYKNLKLKPNNIIITPGGKTAIFYAFLIIGEKSGEAILPEISFPTYVSLAKYTGMRVKKYKINEKNFFRPKAEDIIKLVTNKTKLIVVNSPHNPTGAVMEDDEMKKLANFLKKKTIYLISDEIYSDLIFKKKKYYSFSQFKYIREKTIVLNGWSKNFGMTGWRIGWSYWPKRLIKNIELLCLNSNTCPSYVSQKIIEKIILKKRFILEHRKQLLFNLNYLLKKYKDILNRKPDGAIYLFLKIAKKFKSDRACCKFFLEKLNIAIIPGSSFGVKGKRFVRVNFSKDLIFVEKFMKNFIQNNA